jgi:hypothetical protein
VIARTRIDNETPVRHPVHVPGTIHAHLRVEKVFRTGRCIVRQPFRAEVVDLYLDRAFDYSAPHVGNADSGELYLGCFGQAEAEGLLAA